MNNKNLDGKTFLTLSVQKQILGIRKDIESNHQHAGPQFELVKQAYDEIQVAHGYGASKYKPSCSGCINQINHALTNWLKLFDTMGVSEQRIIKAPEFQKLTPVKESKSSPAEPKEELTFKQMLDKFKEVATDKDKERLMVGGKMPKKAKLIEYFNGK